ncbi:hypothetical protein [Treponema primitia]|uniref:hypothetical protein n=1 Tax=Treponema primitia TaxID=88058 RepID=UPI001FDEE9FF|nr:hypothetical protein [Treponema primitia]
MGASVAPASGFGAGGSGLSAISVDAAACSGVIASAAASCSTLIASAAASRSPARRLPGQ